VIYVLVDLRSQMEPMGTVHERFSNPHVQEVWA
jgi:hypothetical protein